MLTQLGVLLICLYMATGEPLNLWPQKLTKVNEQKDILEVSLEFDNDGPIAKVNGVIKQAVAFDNDWRVNVTIMRSAASDDGYLKLINLPEQGICELMASYYKRYFYDTLKDHANAPDPDVCPVGPDTYTIKDYPLQTDMQKLFKAGHYRILIAVLLDETEKFSYMLTVQLA